MIPITGDEAYYILWGSFPQLGYYDQSPMIGWWQAFLQLWAKAGPDTLWFLRLPATLLSTFVAWILYKVLRSSEASEKKAVLGAELFLWNPLTLLPVILSTDTPLLYFSAIALSLIVSQRFFLVGIALGLGFLSKYFAVLEFLAFSLAVFTIAPRKKALLGVLKMSLGIFPFVLFHIWWNSENCWINFTFNLNTRNANEGFQFSNVATLVLFQVYMIGPLVLWGFLKKILHRQISVPHEKSARIGLCLYVVTFGAFFVSSFKAAQGFHWMYLALPGLYLFFVSFLSEIELGSWLVRMRIWCAIHGVAFLVLFFWPESSWQKTGIYSRYVLFRHGEAVAQALEEKWSSEKAHVLPEFVLTDGYTEASLLHFFVGRHFSVFHGGGKFGRLDDTLTDFRLMAGKDLYIMTHGIAAGAFFQKYFDRVDHETMEVRGANYHLWVGRNFNYPLYRDEKLAQGAALFYPKPAWSKNYSCPFIQKYFPFDSGQGSR